jgi:hypothetical protein
MTGRLTIWGAGQLLTTYFGQTTTSPQEFYLALIKTIAPTPYLSGAELDEPENPDYARVLIENDLAHWSNASQPQIIINVVPSQFITATSDWGQIGYWALTNAQVDGYNLIIGDLANPVIVNEGDQVQFEAGDLSVALGPFLLDEEE